MLISLWYYNTRAGYIKKVRKLSITAIIAASFILIPAVSRAFMPDAEVQTRQAAMLNSPTGERIAYWAGQFIGTPYDTDPMGEYVTRNMIEADDKVDCMYLTFRAAELALSNSPAGAASAALRMRFPGQGLLNADGTVLNYAERFQYGEDMLLSGKWGENMTAHLGAPVAMYKGARGIKTVPVIMARDIPKIILNLRDGDIVYFVKDSSKRTVGEIVGHIGIISREGDRVYMIHASGSKKTGGKVKKVDFAYYAAGMPFVGVMVGRLR